VLSSFYIGASGMKTHATGLSVHGNNIANVNTVGFKSSQITFANLMSRDLYDTANQVGYSQLGLGSQVNDIKKCFTQGGFQTTNTLSDLGISGNGFFGVAAADSGDMYYTRAGNFRIDNQGYMVTPGGLRLQGTAMDSSAASGDIRFTPGQDGNVTLDPRATTHIASYSNLGSGDYSQDSTDPYFSMAKTWDGTASPPLEAGAYAYSTNISVYDAEGNTHEVTIYYDEVTPSSNSGNSSYWEFVVGFNPGEDGRSAFEGTSAAGMLMMGTLEFDSKGQLLNMSAFTNNGQGGMELENWVPSSFDDDGYPQFDVTFGDGESTSISLDLGLKNTAGGWNNSVSNAGAIGIDPSRMPHFDGKRGSRSVTSYSGSSSTTYQSQDGYGEGFLKNFSVDNEGVITGHYSNGESVDLYQVNMYDFINRHGLSAEGNNLYAATNASGQVREGFAGAGAFGDITQYTLEQSNVDLAREFVGMITTQRGLQANSKIITTSDSILQNALQIKR